MLNLLLGALLPCIGCDENKTNLDESPMIANPPLGSTCSALPKLVIKIFKHSSEHGRPLDRLEET